MPWDNWNAWGAWGLEATQKKEFAWQKSHVWRLARSYVWNWLKSDYKILTSNVKPNIERSQKGTLMNVHVDLIKWIKSNRIEPNGLNRTDWLSRIESDRMHWIGPNALNRTATDWIEWIGLLKHTWKIGFESDCTDWIGPIDWIGSKRIESDLKSEIANAWRLTFEIGRFWTQTILGGSNTK